MPTTARVLAPVTFIPRKVLNAAWKRVAVALCVEAAALDMVEQARTFADYL